MRIPVLAVLDSQEPLQESAMAATESREPQVPLEAAATPPGMDLDTSFPAVPVGTGDPREMSLESLGPTTSDRFIVRGYMEAEDPEDIPAEADGRPLFADPVIAPFITCAGDPPVGSAADVATKLNVASLHGRGLDGTRVAMAVLDTGVNLQHLRTQTGSMPRFDAANSWQSPGSLTAPGNHKAGHGTMCAFDALIAAPQCTLLDYPILSVSAPGGAPVAGTLATAVQAYAHLLAFWGVAFAPGGAANYNALVVNNSWGVYHPSSDFPAGHPGRYVDNPSHPFMGLVSVLAGAGADIVFAAGNCGAQCASTKCQGRVAGSIMGANSSPDVLTLAGCDTTDARVGYSSSGPSIAGMHQQKPDLMSYTHFLGSEASGAGTPDSGTSAACPVAAGCVAAIRTKLAPAAAPSSNLFAQLRATATRVGGSPGWNADHGHGIIDPDTAAQTFGI